LTLCIKKTRKERPSNEIQTTLNLLFKEKEHGLYTQDFAKVADFPRADLSIYPPPMPIHARHKLRLCAPKFHLILTS
jgi:hypothetical protein